MFVIQPYLNYSSPYKTCRVLLTGFSAFCWLHALPFFNLHALSKNRQHLNDLRANSFNVEHTCGSLQPIQTAGTYFLHTSQRAWIQCENCVLFVTKIVATKSENVKHVYYTILWMRGNRFHQIGASFLNQWHLKRSPFTRARFGFWGKIIFLRVLTRNKLSIDQSLSVRVLCLCGVSHARLLVVVVWERTNMSLYSFVSGWLSFFLGTYYFLTYTRVFIVVSTRFVRFFAIVSQQTSPRHH